MAALQTVWCCFIPDPSGLPGLLQGLEAKRQEQGAQAQGCPGPGWVMVWHLHPVHPVLPWPERVSSYQQTPPSTLPSCCFLLPRPSSSLSLSPFTLSLLLFLSTPAPLLPSPFLLPPPPPLASLSILLSHPLVFLLSACPADLHARCVEAAQLDLMPPAVRSRAGSGLTAERPWARAASSSVHPTTLAQAFASFCITLCSSSPLFPFYIL